MGYIEFLRATFFNIRILVSILVSIFIFYSPHHNIITCLAELHDSLYQTLSPDLQNYRMYNVNCLKHFLFFQLCQPARG